MGVSIIKHEVVNIKFREGKGERYEIVPGKREWKYGILTLHTTQGRTVMIPMDVIRSAHVMLVLEDE